MANFNGNEGTFISLNDGSDMTSAFRAEYSSENKGYFFGKNKINTLLGQTDAMGLRIYFGVDGNGKMNLVIVAAKANNDDILTNILDVGTACPNCCGTSNDLNS